MERNVTYLTEEELNRIVDEAITDTIKNAWNGAKQAATQAIGNRSSEFKQGWDAYKNAQQNGQSGFNAIKTGVNTANQANYNNRTYNDDGTIKKPGFFDGTFTTIADSFTGGKWSKVRNGLANINMQRAYEKPNYNTLNSHEQKLFDFWIQNINGNFDGSLRKAPEGYTGKTDSNGNIGETPEQEAVRMWNEWYQKQTQSKMGNNALNMYIKDCITSGIKPSQMSYSNFLEFCKKKGYNKASFQQNESLQRLLRKNLMQLI